jgi:hypothetical protein
MNGYRYWGGNVLRFASVISGATSFIFLFWFGDWAATGVFTFATYGFYLGAEELHSP